MGFEYLRYKRNEQLAKSLFEKSLQHINEESYSLQAHDAHIEVARIPVMIWGILTKPQSQ